MRDESCDFKNCADCEDLPECFDYVEKIDLEDDDENCEDDLDLSSIGNAKLIKEIGSRLEGNNMPFIPLSEYSSYALLKELQSVNRKDVRITSLLNSDCNEVVYMVIIKLPN